MRPPTSPSALLVFVTSCDERRFGEWEYVSWWDFVGAISRSEEYQHVAALGLTRTLVAAKEKIASTRTIGNMGEAFVMNIMGRGNDGAPDRVLDLPTDEAWIHPWVRLLRRHGRPLSRRADDRGARDAATARSWARGRAADSGRRRRVEADWFVVRDARGARAEAVVAEGAAPPTRSSTA